MKSLLSSLIFLLLIPIIGYCNIIFEDNFNQYNDWSTSTSYNIAEIWPDTILTALDDPGDVNDAPDWYSYRSASISNTVLKPLYTVDSTVYRGSDGKSLQYNIENASYMNGGGMDLYLGGGASGGYDELWLSFWIKFETDFDFEDDGGNFIKLFRLYTGVDPVNDDYAPSSTYATFEDYNASPQIKRSMNCYLDIVTDGNKDYRLQTSYFFGQQNGVDYISISKTPASSVFNLKNHLGEWVYMQLHAKLNSVVADVPQYDGFLRLWAIPESTIVNYDVDTPTSAMESIRIRSTTDRKFNCFIMLDNMSGQWERAVSEQTIALDDLAISTTELGPDYVIGTPTTAPTVTCQANDSTTNSTYPITATYTLEAGRSVSACTWSSSIGGSGTLTATGGNITGTITLSSIGAHVITIELTDDQAESGSCNTTITRTSTSNLIIQNASGTVITQSSSGTVWSQ